MSDLRKIAFVLEDFELGKPSQQLLDRFLIGYPREGEFYQIENCRFDAHLKSGSESADLARRTNEFGLGVVSSLREAVTDSDAVFIAWKGAGAVAMLVFQLVILFTYWFQYHGNAPAPVSTLLIAPYCFLRASNSIGPKMLPIRRQRA